MRSLSHAGVSSNSHTLSNILTGIAFVLAVTYTCKTPCARIHTMGYSLNFECLQCNWIPVWKSRQWRPPKLLFAPHWVFDFFSSPINGTFPFLFLFFFKIKRWKSTKLHGMWQSLDCTNPNILCKSKRKFQFNFNKSNQLCVADMK